MYVWSWCEECFRVFSFLNRYLPQSAATMLTGLWYGFLLWAIFFCVNVPDAEFRYWWI